MGEKGDMQRVLYEWRNVPKSHGFSPAQLLFGRSQNMLIPQPPAAFLPIDFSEAALARDQLFNSQADYYNRDKVNLEQLSPGQSVRVQNENTGLWDLTGTVIDIRPDGLSYLIDIEGRTFFRGQPKLKPVFKARSHEVGVLESESSPGEGVISVDKETSSHTEPSSANLRRSSRLREKCVAGSSSSLVCGLSSDTRVQHMPFSYSVPCPALGLPAEERQIRRNLRNSERWLNCTETTPMRTQSTNQIPEYPCSTFNGQVSQAPSSSVVSGRPRQDEDAGKIRSVCSKPLVQLAPQLMSPHPLLQGPVSLPLLPPLSPGQTGSGSPPDGRVFPHHTLLDPVEFRGFRTPNSRHYYTTGISTDVATLHVARSSRWEPSRPSHVTPARPMAPCPGLPRSGTRMTGTGDLSPGLPVDVPLVGEGPLLG